MTATNGTARRRRAPAAALACALVLAALAAAEEPAWVAKVPDFRSQWPEPLAIGTAPPNFVLENLADGKRVDLAKARASKRATLVLFLDDNCSTCKTRGPDLAATLDASRKVEGATALVVFVTNLAKTGEKGARAYAEKAGLPDVPLLLDDRDGRSETALAWHVPVTPCAAVLDAQGRLAYFGLALPLKGSDLVPAIVARVAEGKPAEEPAVRAPYG